MYPDPNVLVGFDKADDAGVYRLDDQTAAVQTVDFFTPIVDDPFTYGEIAAANSLSDIYAMGGTPRFALSIVCFPKDKLGEDVLHEILRGGTEKMNEAQVPVIGGHSVEDQEMKFGYCVTGMIHPDKIYSNGGAQPGDVLLLTKPLGTGIIATGIKYEKTPPEVAQDAVEWMRKLNAVIHHEMEKLHIHAVTDITGFGLVGHAFEMAQASGTTLVFSAEKVPVIEGTEALAKQGMLPGGIESNRRYVGDSIVWHGVSSLRQQIMLDPQTSGGLLISLPEEEAEQLASDLKAERFLGEEIGRVSDLKDAHIQVKR